MSLTDRINRSDRREAALPVIVERRSGDDRRLSPMARRVLANKADGLRTGGTRPMGADGTSAKAA